MTAAHADSLAVRGSACGYVTNVGLFGGPQSKLGCEPQAGQSFAPAGEWSRAPSVALPTDGSGSATPLTAFDGDGAAGRYGPAVIFGGRWPADVAQAQPSGPISVSTQGTPAGGVTSSTDIMLHPTPKKVACYDAPGECDAPGGYGPFPVEGDSMHVECSASDSGVTGSTRLTNSVLATETDAEGTPTVYENVPDNPPPNYTRQGVITNVGDIFTVVYNQQFVSSDGTLTVIGAHMYLFGPTAVGEVIKGMVTCGVSPASAQSGDDLAPVCTTAIVEQNSPTEPTPKTPRTERVGAFDTGGIRSIENIGAINAEVSVGQPSSQHEYLRFTPGQTGPLVLVATRTAEAEAQNGGMYWSFDVVDMAGHRTHCTGMKLGPPVAADDSYQTTENTELNVAAPGVLGNDSPAPDGGPLSAVRVSQPANGTVQLQADGSFIYLPNPLFVGLDSFTYRADDGYGSDDATVTITVTPAQTPEPPPVSTDPVAEKCRGLAKATGRTVLQNKDCNRLF